MAAEGEAELAGLKAEKNDEGPCSGTSFVDLSKLNVWDLASDH